MALPSCSSQRSRGFTLIQLLVALGIGAVLMSLALPAVMRARNSAKRTAIFYQLQMISTGLEAYKQDFGFYPQIDLANANIPDTGAFALCRALFGPAPALGSNTDLFDNYDGAGFKMGTTGKVFGPYLSVDNFRFGYAVPVGDGTSEMSAIGTEFVPADYGRLMVADRTDKPIFYCPALPAKPRFNNANTYFAAQKPAPPMTPPAGAVYYFDLNCVIGNPNLPNPELTTFRGIARQVGETDDNALIARTQKLLGDVDNDGRLGATEKPAVDAPYLLWSPGLDGRYGAVAGKTPDDVLYTNFGQ